MVSEVSIHEFKKKFFEIYGIDFIDGLHLFQSPLNVVQHGDFKLYDNYADEDIYVELPILKNLFEKEEEVYIYTQSTHIMKAIYLLLNQKR